MQLIVLHHGLMGFNSLGAGGLRIRYWDGIPRAIAQAGYPVLATRVHPTAGIVRRAGQLKEQILRTVGKLGEPLPEVIILAHSMGGLDARYMVTHLGMSDLVKAVVTISSPHRGSPYYDHLVGQLGWIGRLQSVHESLVDIQAFWDVTAAYCRVFNEKVPNAPGVNYYCVTASCSADRVPIFLEPSYRVILEADGENDGLVSAQSARWGMELAHWPFHHFHLINWPMRVLSPPSTEDVRPRYLQLLSLLRTDGALEAPAEIPSAALSAGR